MKAFLYAVVVSYYVSAVIHDVKADDYGSTFRLISVTQIYNDNDARMNHRRRTNSDVVDRILQVDSNVTCSFTPHGQAISCVERTGNDDTVRYSVSCPAGVTVVDQCLQDQKRICYQFNSRPCIGGFYCASSNRFSLDCGNLFARSNGNTCSKTDCDVNCAELRDVPVDYNSVDLDNDCFQLGLSSVTNAGIVTTEWTHVLSDGVTQIQVTGTRNSAANSFSSCAVTVAGQAGSMCPCNVNCSPTVNAISYDCTAFSNDPCAAIDCSGNCLPSGFPSPVAVVAPVAPPVAAPMTPPITAPVTPPITPPVVAPVAAPVTPPVTPPIVAPVAAPVTAPVTPPVVAPVVAPVTAPVTPPVVAPVVAPVTAPVTPPVVAPVVAPVTAPVTPPVVAPVAAPVTPPVTPPVVAPVATPVTPPVTPPVVAPVAAPVNPPVTAPVMSPVTIPMAAPVTPIAPPVLSPVGIITSPPVMRPIRTPTSNSTICPLWWGLF